jgi:hypothetical protein
MNWTTEAIKKMVDENPEGFTVDIKTGKKRTKYYAVALTHGLKVEDAGLIANTWMFEAEFTPAFGSATHTLGGWKDHQGNYVIDLGLIIVTKEKALQLGAEYNQYSIFDLTNGKEIVVSEK